MKSLRTKIAAVAIAVAALIAAPAAAQAYTPVAPDGPTTVSPGVPVGIPFSDFQPNENVTFVITGENGAGASLSLGFIKTAITSASQTFPANGSGAVTVNVTLPSNASGTYTLTGTGQSSGESASVQITASSTGGTTDDPTGFDAGSMLGVWIGGGVLLLGGVLVTVFAARRERQDA